MDDVGWAWQPLQYAGGITHSPVGLATDWVPAPATSPGTPPMGECQPVGHPGRCRMRRPLYHAGPRRLDAIREYSSTLDAHASPGRMCPRIGPTYTGAGISRDAVVDTVYTPL